VAADLTGFNLLGSVTPEGDIRILLLGKVLKVTFEMVSRKGPSRSMLGALSRVLEGDFIFVNVCDCLFEGGFDDSDLGMG
jgi:hypothetical protein